MAQLRTPQSAPDNITTEPASADVAHAAALADLSEKDTSRLMAFSDGVFAIAITLLALDLRVPASQPDAAALAQALARMWPNYLTFVLSFATILIMWVYHHRLFQSVKRATTALLFSNGFLLLLVTAVPFPTSLVGAYLTQPAAATACAFYAAFFACINLAYNLLWWVVLRERATYALKFAMLPTSFRVSLLGLPAYLLAALAAFVSPYITLAVCIGLWVVWAVTAHTLRGEWLMLASAKQAAAQAGRQKASDTKPQ